MLSREDIEFQFDKHGADRALCEQAELAIELIDLIRQWRSTLAPNSINLIRHLDDLVARAEALGKVTGPEYAVGITPEQFKGISTADLSLEDLRERGQ